MTGRAGFVELWWARATRTPELAALLDGAEHSRLATLRRPDDQRRYVAAHALLRIVLGTVMGTPPPQVPLDYTCATCGEPHGGPHLAGPGLSLAHAGDLVAVAVANTGVGIDLEPYRPPFAGFDEVALTAGERAALPAGPEHERDRLRLRWWTRKEALLKVGGDGLRVDPATVDVRADPRVVDLELHPDYAAAVATDAPGPNVRLNGVPAGWAARGGPTTA